MTACNSCGRALVEPEAFDRGLCWPSCEDVEQLDEAFDRLVDGGKVCAADGRSLPCFDGCDPCAQRDLFATRGESPLPVMRNAVAGAMVGHARHGFIGAAVGALLGGVADMLERRRKTVEARAAAQDEAES